MERERERLIKNIMGRKLRGNRAGEESEVTSPVVPGAAGAWFRREESLRHLLQNENRGFDIGLENVAELNPTKKTSVWLI